MDFVEFLKQKHVLVKGERKLKEISAHQYHNRLQNMMSKGIYDGESPLTNEIVKNINTEYVNASNEYERTITLYLQYRRHLESRDS